MGPSGAKQGQMVPNGAKQGQTWSNKAKNGQKVPYGAKRCQKGQWGQTRPNGVMWRIFCMHAYFYENKKSYFATQALRQKLAELLRYCYFLGYYGLSLKTWALFLYLSEDFFLISSESLFIWLYFEPQL